jgi:hypothetical protein
MQRNSKKSLRTPRLCGEKDLSQIQINSSFIERCNGTAHLMEKAQVCKTLALAKREHKKLRLDGGR